MYNKPKITIMDNKINVVNFTNIDHFSDNKVIIKINDKEIIISGSNLIISRLVIDEILINGCINKIEFR